MDESNGWFGGTLCGDQDESSEIYKHYAELCQVIMSIDVGKDCILSINIERSVIRTETQIILSTLPLNVYGLNVQGFTMEAFENDADLEKHYTELLRMDTIEAIDEGNAEEEMEAALKEYDQIGADLGLTPLSCRSFAGASGSLSQWIIGQDMMQKS